MNQEYEMQELVPIVAKLAEQYTGFESTSITYEKAEQLMEAVLYCIHEMETAGKNALSAGEKIPAQQAYELGRKLVEQKTKAALHLYHEILEDFDWYENRCLYDTIAKGMPEFFKWYDTKFAPQDTILTLDYPIRKDLSGCSGVDRIYEYLICIRAEQNFLKKFPREYVIDTLRGYTPSYRDMIENLCEIVVDFGKNSPQD